MATSSLGYQNKFSTTLLSSIGTTDTTVYLNAMPVPSEGYVTLDEGLSSEEIIYYTSKGANFVTLPSVLLGRGIGGTTAIGHSANAVVKMKVIDKHFTSLQDGSALSTGVASGWLPSDSTWVYASATTFTVSASDAAKMNVGTKLQFVQTTTKYFSVTGVSGTTVTVTGGSDYTVANAAISSSYLSNASSPVGFPQWFNYSPTVTGFSSTPTTATQFKVDGHSCVFIYSMTLATSNANTFTVTLPVAAVVSSVQQPTVILNAYNAGALSTSIDYGRIVSTSPTIISLAHADSNSGWTNSGSKGAYFTIVYPI